MLETEDAEDIETEDNTDDCLTEAESREYILWQFKEQYPNVACTQMVFFYEIKFVKSVYGALALEKMQQNDSFILYQKGKLKEAIEELISKADIKH